MYYIGTEQKIGIKVYFFTVSKATQTLIYEEKKKSYYDLIV